MNKGSNLTVIIVTHNRLDYLKRTIMSLERTVPDASFVLVDNASTDGTVQWFSNVASVYTLREAVNKGWGSAVNIALRTTMLEDYVLLSNNDVEYEDGWYEECLALYQKYPQIGVLGVWKHPSHGVLEDKGDLIVKDQMPAVGWLMTPEHIKDIGAFPEHGPCATKGGNGEDVEYCIRTANKGYLVASPKEDVAIHIDGY